MFQLGDLVEINTNITETVDGARGILRHINELTFGVEIISTFTGMCGKIVTIDQQYVTLISKG